MKTKAVAYYRTSSAANVDGDLVPRQRAAVDAYARRARIEIVEEFDDPAISGTDAVEARPGFARMLAALRKSDVRTVIVETSNRFARDLIVQETGWHYLKSLGVELIAADSPNAFLDDTPTSVLIRQILGAVSQFDKAMTVAKLRAARERLGKLGGRRPVAEQYPDATARARQLDGSLSKIAERLAIEGFVAVTGKPFAPSTVRVMRQ